jgi:hypothetical protein
MNFLGWQPPTLKNVSMRRGILRSVGGVLKPGFFLNPGDDAKIIAETRFLGLLAAANPSDIASVFFKRSRQRIITA